MMQLLLVLQLLSSCLAGPGEQLEQALKLLQEQQATQRQQQEMQTQLLLIIQQQQQQQQQQQNQQQQQMQMLLPPAPFMQVQPQLFPQMLLPAQMQMPQMQFPPAAPPIEEIEDEQLQELPWFHCPKPLAPKPPSKEART